MSSFEKTYLQYQGIPLPRAIYSDDFKFVEEFKFRDDDVLAVTYPKSGTVWMQYILPLVLNDGDMRAVQTTTNWRRAPWLEVKRTAPIVDQLTPPRVLVTHFPYNLMPPSLHTSKTKVIYVMRDPKDVLVSSFYYHQMANFLEDPGTFDEFMKKFLEGRVQYGKWTNHVKGWRHTELGDRIMYITYEEMVQDLPASVRRISDFLCCNVSDDVIHNIAEQSSFMSMKSKDMSNVSHAPKEYLDSTKSTFLRKGIVGDWKNHFSSEQETHFTSVIDKELEEGGPTSMDGRPQI
ncbi:sulfotransferase 2B1 [Nothobranchius furzeri]|uniref:Sulfotransferase n=1 Tax=Nothobranchius furzeri TaxID=105023 RepID=A0A8C6KPZ7_NOTFU|nr:sulfotransferase 2B1 [Nothobranchius furzeri]